MREAIPRELRFEPTAKWIRAELGGQTVVDSKRALVVWMEKAIVPGYAFPREDVKLDALSDDAVFTYEDPDLADYVGIQWDAPDAWFEEAEEIVGHPRDPFHRVDVRDSSRHVRVEVDGEVIAESTRPRLLFETGLPTRYYFPREDVRMDLLTPTDRETYCAYKGQASYWTVNAGERPRESLAWTYEEPLTDSRQIEGLISFFNERCDIFVDGEPAGRPKTQWS